MERMIEDEKMRNANTLDPFVNHINMILADHQVQAKVEVKYRMPYSIWRKMQKENKDFQHVNNHHYVKIIFLKDWSARKEHLPLPLLHRRISLRRNQAASPTM